MNELFEKELRNTSINDKSLADYVIENYVPMSVLEDIKAELMSEKYAFIIPTKTVIEIIDRYISGEEQGKE